MEFELWVTLGVLALAVVLFCSERIPAGHTALLAAGILLATGVLPPEEVFKGFSNVATVTVGSMFVVSAGIYQTGAVHAVSERLSVLLQRSELLALCVLTAGAGLLSFFVNNTTVVTILLPVLLRASREAEINASRLLMPLSFACMLAGTCTLVGTSTNLVVSSVAVEQGLAPIRMFEMAPVGLALFGTGVLYLIFVAPRLLPVRRASGAQQAGFDLASYLTTLRIEEDSPADGVALRLAEPLVELDLDVISLTRDGWETRHPSPDRVLRAGDLLEVRCSAEELSRIAGGDGLTLLPAEDALPESKLELVEVVIGPRSPMVGRQLGVVDWQDQFGAVPLGVRQQGRVRHEALAGLALRAGDVLLMHTDPLRRHELERRGDFVLVSQLSLTHLRRERMPLAVGILAGVVLFAASGTLPIAVAALLGAVLVLLTGCARHEEAIEAIDWNVMMLLAGVISLGAAMERSGAADLFARAFADALGGLGPHAAVAALYLTTALVTSFLSNNATAALLTPVGIALGPELGLDPRACVMTIVFGASTAMLTPIGYQTNTLVYGAGHYRFTDFARVGAPLLVPLTALVAFLVPRVWPLAS